MIKKTFSLFLASLVVFISSYVVLNTKQANAQEGYAWILQDRIDYDGRDDVAQQSRSTLYDAQASYSPGEYSITKTYTGDWVEGIENAPENGETATAFANFGNIPDVIYPDWPVKIDFSLGFSDRRIINYRGGGGETSAEVFFCQPDNGPSGGDGGYPDFKDASGEYRFISGAENGFSNIQKNLSSEIGPGEKKGNRIGLCTRQHFGGIGLGTNYVYEWLPLTEKYAGVTEPPRERYEVPKDENGEYIDSGVRVSDIGGEVMVRHGDDPLGWEMLNAGDVIYAGDVIWTGHDSDLILSMSDLTTFKMRSESAIIMNTESEKESKLKILGGKIIANVKKMIETGSMSVEMSQAVAGIKGTIFVIESDDTKSKLKVLEGQVEMTSKNGDKKLVEAGRQIIAMDNSLGEIEDFSIANELNSWDTDTKNDIAKEIEERTGQKVDFENITKNEIADTDYFNNKERSDNEKSTSPIIYIFVVLIIIMAIIGFKKFKK